MLDLTTTGGVGTLVLSSVAGAEQLIPTKIMCCGSSFHGHHRAIEGEVDWRIAAIHRGLGTPCGRPRVRPTHRQGRSTQEDDDSRTEEPRRMCWGEDGSAESCAEDIGEVEGEVEGSDD